MTLIIYIPLCYLPHNQIVEAYELLSDKAMFASNKLKELIAYVGRTWVYNTETYTVANWSVFNKTVRTNIDVEGWHAKVDTKGRDYNSFYKLISLLNLGL